MTRAAGSAILFTVTLVYSPTPRTELWFLIAMAGLSVGILSVVLWGILHYRCWCVLPERTARTTPGKAVGFMFIPFFSVVWVFVSYRGLVIDLINYADANDSVISNIRRGVATLLGISYCLWFILFLYGLARPIPAAKMVSAMAVFCLQVVFYVTVARAARTIAAWRIENQV